MASHKVRYALHSCFGVEADVHLPVEINVHTVATCCIYQDILRVSITESDCNMADDRPHCCSERKPIPGFVPSMRVLEILDEPPVKDGWILLEAELFKQHSSLRQLPVLEEGPLASFLKVGTQCRVSQVSCSASPSAVRVRGCLRVVSVCHKRPE
jgi:hypothetical protein